MENSVAKLKEYIQNNKSVKLINDPEGIEEIVSADSIEKLQKLIRGKGIESLHPIESKFLDEEMRIPLIQYCVMKEAMRCFKFLLINGLDDPKQTMLEPSVENQKYEWDCMAVAIYCGQQEMAKILEEQGFEKGSNPGHLEAAILAYRNDIAKDIIRDLKEDAPNRKEILTVGLNAAAQSNNIKGFEILISKGAYINAENKDGVTPLHWAADENSKEIGELLISKGANINAKDNTSDTPLHWAANWNSKEMGEILDVSSHKVEEMW